MGGCTCRTDKTDVGVKLVSLVQPGHCAVSPGVHGNGRVERYQAAAAASLTAANSRSSAQKMGYK